MKIRNALTLAALAALMALPFAANAQSQDKHNDKRGDQMARGSDRSDHNQKSGGSTQGARDRNRQGGDKRDSTPPRPVQSNGNRGSQQNRQWDDKRDNTPNRPVQDVRKEQDWQRKTDQHIGDNRWSPPAIRDDHWSGGRNWYRSDHNDWRDIANTLGFIADIARIERDDTIYFDGQYGAYYPVAEYDQDCRSTDRAARERAEFFGRDFFYRDNHRFERRIVMNHGERSYQFVRVG